MAGAQNEPASYGEYEIESLLGKGSIGKVYLARHRRIGRRVALKIIRPEQRFDDEADRVEFQRRLQREAELCASLHHPNVVTLFEAGYEDDVIAFLATEYVEGESLQARLKKTRPLPLDDALQIGSDVLRALAYAHAKGVIHRDIKPGNIIIAGTGQAKITDFGIARPVDSSLTGTNSLLGTPNYMSPEQVKSSAITPRADLFSAGAVMYEMLTGVKPFSASDISGILYNVVNLDPPAVDKLNPTVPRPIAKVVARLLAKAPQARYPSAADALADIERFHSSAPPPAAGASTIAAAIDQSDTTTPLHALAELEPTEVPFYRRRVPTPLFWTVTLLLTIALAAGVLWLRSRGTTASPSGEITIEQLATFEAKRRELAAARAFAAAHNYNEAIRRYNIYLAKYPESVTAMKEREEARRNLILPLPSDKTITVSKPRPGSAESPPPQPPSRWERIKRWFRGDNQQKH